jgi:hypothetical protein
MIKPQKGTKSIKVGFLIFSLLALMPVPIVAQNDEAKELWRVRSQTLTDDLLKDAAQLSPLRRAVLWMRLAQLWWEADGKRARGWFRNAIEVIEQVPNKENEADRIERLVIARNLVRIISPLDQKLASGLVTLLKNVNEQSSVGERTSNADALIASAVAVVNQDPKRAAELASLALRVGPPNDFADVLFALRKHEPKLADALFTETLALAKQNLSLPLLYSLTHAAFPQYPDGRYNSLLPPENFRAELLRLDVAFLNANPINDANRDSICSSIGSLIAPVLSEFDTRTPQQAIVVRQAINQCRGVHPMVQQQLDSTLNNEPMNTVEALLKAAANSEDVNVRTIYEYRAAALAKEKNDYERALKILDGISKEGREFMGEAWESFRWQWAATGALEHFRLGRLLEMNLILNDVPADLQPLAKGAFVDRLPEKRSPEGDPALQFLNDARSELRRSNVRESEKVGCYFFLLRSIVKYDRAATSTAIKEAFAAMNRAEQSNPDKDRPVLNTGEYLQLLPASLLEVDEFAVREGIASLTTVETRAQLRLALLSSTIKRMQPAQH